MTLAPIFLKINGHSVADRVKYYTGRLHFLIANIYYFKYVNIVNTNLKSIYYDILVSL